MAETIIIQNIQKYTLQISDGNLILTRIIQLVDEATLFQKNLRGSTILECKINGVNNDIKKYKKLLYNLYSTTDNTTDKKTILQNTTLNISQQERYDKGYDYNAFLGVSIQRADARRTLKEIINIINKLGDE